MSGCLGQSCGGEPVVDVALDRGQGSAELGRGMGLADGEERGEDAVMDFADPTPGCTSASPQT